MKNYVDLYVMTLCVLCAMCFGIGFMVGQKVGTDYTVNKVCQQTQYEFCQPTYTYKAKGGNNE